MTKDYYRILGVLDDAEDVVIRASYKALAQRYHPDKWTGDKQEANRRMQEINEAYAILSDSLKRKQYDDSRDKHEYADDESLDEEELNSPIEDAWRLGVEFYPDLIEEEKNLRKINIPLANTFKLLLIENKCFDRGSDIAKEMENDFLERYFGKDKRIIYFAKMLIGSGDKKALHYLNRIINVMGSSVTSEKIIEKVQDKFPFETAEMYRTARAITLARKIRYSEYHNVSDLCLELLKELHVNVSIDKLSNVWMYQFKYGDINHAYDQTDFMNFVRKFIVPKICIDSES